MKYLNVLKFKPLREGFDFLTLIDSNQRYPGDTGKDDDEDEEESSRGLRGFAPSTSSDTPYEDSDYEMKQRDNVERVKGEGEGQVVDQVPHLDGGAFEMDENVEVSHNVLREEL